MNTSAINSIFWNDLPWDQFGSRVFRLQCRIYKAKQMGDIKKTIRLQKLLIKSTSTHCIAVKYVTQSHFHRKNPGIDGKLILTSKERFDCVNQIYKEIENWLPSPVKRLFLSPFEQVTDATFVNICTIEDRIIQYIWKLALEPAQKSIVSTTDFGFETKISVWDIQKSILRELAAGTKDCYKKILVLDINESLCTLNPKFINSNLIFPIKYKISLFKAIKLGLFYKSQANPNLGLPEGDLYSLLLNIILDGVENLSILKEQNSNSREKNITFTSFRYSNKLIYILKTHDKDHEKIILKKVTEFITMRGLQLNCSKTQFRSAVNGFDFLGWRFILKPSGKVISYPTKKSWISYKNKVKAELKNSRYPIQFRLSSIKILVKEWHSYHKLCDMSQLKAQLYGLKKWYSNYLSKSTSMSKLERITSLKTIFNNPSSDYVDYVKDFSSFEINSL